MTTPSTSQTNPLDPVFSGIPVVFPQTGMINPTWNKWFVDLRQKLNVINAETATPVIKVHPGTNVTVDNTDPQNPIISSTGGALPSGGTAGQVLTKVDSTPGNADWQTPGVGSSLPYIPIIPYANPVSTDPYWSSVTSQLRFQGSPGTTSVVDDIGLSWAVTGSFYLAGTLYQYGTSCGNVNSSIIQTPYVKASFDWWMSDFTLEVFLTSFSGTVFNSTAPIIGNVDPNGGINYWNLGLNSSGNVVFYYYNGSAAIAATSQTLLSSFYNHVMISFVKATSTIYVGCNGIVTSSALSGTPQSSTSYPLVFGKSAGNYSTFLCSGIRITKGVARYTANYTVPSPIFPTS